MDLLFVVSFANFYKRLISHIYYWPAEWAIIVLLAGVIVCRRL